MKTNRTVESSFKKQFRYKFLEQKTKTTKALSHLIIKNETVTV